MIFLKNRRFLTNNRLFRKVVDLMRDHRHSAQNFAAVISSMVLEHLFVDLFFGVGGGAGPLSLGGEGWGALWGPCGALWGPCGAPVCVIYNSRSTALAAYYWY